MQLRAGREMASVANRAQYLTGAEGAGVELVEGSDMVLAAAIGSAALHLGVRFPRAGSLSGLCVERAEALCTHDAAADARVNADAARRMGITSMACVPVVVHDRAVGVLEVVSSRPRAFGDGVLETLAELSGLLAPQLALAVQDPLTALGLPRALEARLGEEVARVRRHGGTLSLLLLHVGHGAPDDVLRCVAACLRQLRGADVAFRAGADEFAIVLPDTDAGTASRLGWRVDETLSIDGRVTASWSVAELEPGMLAADLLARASAELIDA